MKLSEYQKSRSFFDLGQRSLRFQSQMFDFWPVYSGEPFRASGPSCFFFGGGGGRGGGRPHFKELFSSKDQKQT